MKFKSNISDRLDEVYERQDRKIVNRIRNTSRFRLYRQIEIQLFNSLHKQLHKLSFVDINHY